MSLVQCWSSNRSVTERYITLVVITLFSQSENYHLPVMLILVLKDQNAVLVLVLVLDDAVLVFAAEVLVLVLEQKSLVMSL